MESSLSRRRDFDITAWVAAALPAAAASWRDVRNLWINEPQFGKMESPSLAPRGHIPTKTFLASLTIRRRRVLKWEVKKIRLILFEDYLVLLFGLSDSGLRWMFSEPDLLQRV